MKPISRNVIFSLLKAGHSKQQVYHKMVDKGHSRRRITELLNSLPSHQHYKKFRFLNILLALTLIAISIGGFWIKIYPLTFVHLVLAYLTFRYLIKLYFWIMIVCSLGITSFLVLMINVKFAYPEGAVYFVYAWGISMLISFFFTQKTLKKPAERRIIYQNENGETRSYKEFEFED